MDAAIDVDQLVKVFENPAGEIRAVDDISFHVEKGETFGILGPNGAGKTTTLEIIEGLQTPTSGQVRVLGTDMPGGIDKLRSRIGVQLQEQSSYFKHLRLDELLDLFAVLYGVRTDVKELLNTVGLWERRRAFVKELSGGEQRWFSIAASLVHRPEVLFLDEPTSGLDPHGRRRFWDLVRNIKEGGTTVVLTTHYMEEAETICDRVAIMDRGKVRALDSPLRLVQTLDSAYHIRLTIAGALDETRLRSLPGAAGLTVARTNGELQYDLEIHDPAAGLADLSEMLEGLDVKVEDLRIEPSTLEDVFISLTGRELAE